MEGNPLVKGGAHSQAQRRGGAVGIAAHKGDAATQRLDIVASAARGAVVNIGTLIAAGAVGNDAVPQGVVTLYGLVLRDAGTRQSCLLLLLLVHNRPGGAGVAVVVLAETVNGIFFHHLGDAVEGPLPALGITYIVGNDAIAVGDSPLRLVAIVLDQRIHHRHALGLKPREHLHAGGVAGLVALAQALARPLDGVQLPRAHRAPPVAGHRVALGVEIPAGVKPPEVRMDFLIYYAVEGASPGVETLGDTAVGVGQAGVGAEGGSNKGFYPVAGDVGTRHIVFLKPLAPQVGGVVSVAPGVGQHHHHGGAHTLARHQHRAEAIVVVRHKTRAAALGLEVCLPRARPAEGYKGAAVAVDKVEIGEAAVGGASAIGTEGGSLLEQVLVVRSILIVVVTQTSAHHRIGTRKAHVCRLHLLQHGAGLGAHILKPQGVLHLTVLLAEGSLHAHAYIII